MSILFKNCNILTKEAGLYKTIYGYLGVEGDTIDYIGIEAPKKQYETEKNMSGKLLIPGLVNTHGHSAMTLVRGAGS